MRLRYDPRLTLDRVGQVEFELGGYSQLVDGIARHHKHDFRPYQWRDPSRARDWARLPEDLIELMKAEEVEALPNHQDSSRPSEEGSRAPAGRGSRGETARPGPV